MSSNATIKLVNVSPVAVSPWQLLLLRCCLQMTVVSPVILSQRSSLLSFPDLRTRLLVSCQALLGGLMLLCVFGAIQRLPIGDFSAIAFSSPAITMLLSTCLLGERCGLYRTSIGCCLITGVFIISRPTVIFGLEDTEQEQVEEEEERLMINSTTFITTSPPSTNMTGICLALTLACLSALVTIITKKSTKVATSVLVFWFGFGGLLVSVLGLLWLDTSDSSFSCWRPETWALALLQSLLGISGSFCLYKALLFTSPTSVMIIRSFEIVLSYTIQVTAFGSIIHLLDFLGAFFIVFAVLAISMERWITQKMSDWCCKGNMNGII